MKQLILLLAISLVFFGCTSNQNKTASSLSDQNADSIPEQLHQLNLAILDETDNADLFKQRAEYFLQEKNINEAFKDVSSAIELDSTRSDLFVLQADIYLEMGKIQKTVKSLDQAIALDANNAKAWIRKAEMNIVIREYRKALKNIDRAMEIDDLQPKAFLLRGLVMLETGDTVKGILNLQKAVDIKQDYFDAHLQLGRLYAMKKNDLAIDYFNNAMNADPDNTDVIYFLAMYYQETDRYKEAVKLYENILSYNPTNFIALYNMGYVNLVYAREFETAIQYFNQVIDLNGEYVEAYYNRGFAFELLGDVGNARSDYQKALDLQTNYQKAIDGLNRIDDFLSDQD